MPKHYVSTVAAANRLHSRGHEAVNASRLMSELAAMSVAVNCVLELPEEEGVDLLMSNTTLDRALRNLSDPSTEYNQKLGGSVMSLVSGAEGSASRTNLYAITERGQAVLPAELMRLVVAQDSPILKSPEAQAIMLGNETPAEVTNSGDGVAGPAEIERLRVVEIDGQYYRLVPIELDIMQASSLGQYQ